MTGTRAKVVVELYGVPRLRAGRGRVEQEATTVGEALNGLGASCPTLAGSVLVGDSLHPAYLLNLNGDRFVSDPAAPLADGDVLLLISADAGG
jgi:molybdopterin converting factor small subunit